MASKRVLKKEITGITTVLISECLFSKLYISDENSEKIDDLIMQSFELRREFLKRANVTDGRNNPKIVKSYYKQLVIALDKEIERIIQQLAEIVPA